MVSLVAVFFICIGVAHGFMGNRANLKFITSLSASYEERLAAARNNQNKRETVKEVPPLRKASAEISVSPVKSKSNLPFNDATYENMKYVIEKLTARMKSETPLTKDELRKFESAISAIITDAGVATSAPTSTPIPVVKKAENAVPVLRKSDKIPEAPIKPKKAADPSVVYAPGAGPKSSEAPDPTSVFAPLHGVSNTWQIEGMENMDLETYYRKINERNTEMKRRRKEAGEPTGGQASEAYFESLSKKSRGVEEKQ